MARGRKSALQELIRSGLVADGELLRYKSKHGQLMGIGRAREGGVEVDGGRVLGYTAFEGYVKSNYHRPAEHTHTTGSRTLQGLSLLAAGEGGGGGGGRGALRQDQASPGPPVELLEDENDELCYICGLGGDLVCCESCPAVFHSACLGLEAAPEGDFHCPQCLCATCGGGSSVGFMPTGCMWVDCSRFAAPDAALQQARPHIAPAGSCAATAAEPAAAAEAAAAAAAEGGSGGEPMQVDVVPPAGTADFSQLDAAVSAAWQAGAAPAEAAEAAPAAVAAARAAPDAAAVHCPVACRWSHLRCFPPEFVAQLRLVAQPCISSVAAEETSRRLAAACAAGIIPLGSVAEGARALAVRSSADASFSSGGGGSAPLPLSLLVIRGAAVASPADCRGYAPAYTPQQRQQLQAALSAALHVLHSCYDPLPDSRTGADMLPWLLRGAVLAGGEADYSGMHAVLLYAGPVVVGVAVFRSFGELAELPLLAVRPELQRRNGLGTLLLAATERLLAAVGTQALVMPGLAAGGAPYLPPLPGTVPPALLQSKWGYALAPAEQLLEAAALPLVRLPGVLVASKRLADGGALAPPRLQRVLEWSDAPGLDTRQLLRDGMLASVAPAAGAMAAASRLPPAAARKPPPARTKRDEVSAAAAKAEAAAAGPAAALAAAWQQQPAAPTQQQQAATPAQLQQQQQLMMALYQQQQAQLLAAQQAAQAAAAQQASALAAEYQQQQQEQVQPNLAELQAYHQMLQQQQMQGVAQQQQQMQLDAYAQLAAAQQAAAAAQQAAAAAQQQQQPPPQ